MVKGPITHIIRPQGSKLKVECRLYQTHREMLRAIRKDDIGGIANDTMAYCATERSRMQAGFAAIVYFCKPYLDHDTIAHEMDHASFAIMARQRVKEIPCVTDAAPPVEESHAYLLGSLVGAFYRKYSV